MLVGWASRAYFGGVEKIRLTWSQRLATTLPDLACTQGRAPVAPFAAWSAALRQPAPTATLVQPPTLN
jgi:hypothetical protein